MVNKPPETGPKLIHIIIPAATTLLVALIGLGTAIYQTDKPIQLTQVAETAQASTLTAAPSVTQTAQSVFTPSLTVQTIQPSAQSAPTALATKTPIPPVVATVPSSITVQNELNLPVTISIDKVAKGEIEASSSKIYLLDSFPVTVQWTVVKETTSSGRPLGSDMGGKFSKVNLGDEIVIDHVVENQAYFYPYVTNPTSTDCDVVINKGWKSEVDPNAVVPANTDNVGLGYYELYDNSNVTLTCGTDVYWWGLQADQSGGTSFYNDVDQNSGVIDFTLNP
jgi:hypothetical protein